MSSPAEPPPPEHPPTPAPAPAPASPPPHPAASGNEAAGPPKPNPPITPAPARNASAAPPSGSPATAAAAAPVPSRKESGSTSAAAPAAATRKASGVAAATTGVLPRKPLGTTAPVAARNIPATTAASRTATRATTTTTATSVSRRPAAAAAVASRIPLRATAATTTHAASRNPLTGAAAATATATVAAVGRGGFRAAPTRPEEYTPRMGMEFESEHEAYEFYRYYGWKVGFNVRKEYANKSKKTGEITSRKFACSREGYRANVKRGNHMVPMPDSRTGCNAHLVIRRKKPGAKLEVYAFQPRHNHPLFATSCMPNPLQPNVVHWTTLPDAVTPPDLLMDGGEVGGQESTEENSTASAGEGRRQPLRTRRQWEMKYGEAGALLNYFQDQSLANPSFYHAVQLDVEDKVANVFWADPRMITDYSQFGDVIAFDVVSRNSISLRHFASFVGCNNFGEPIVFGLALMYDETAESFQWLFETFLHAMSGRAPKTFFSHQDAVVAKAVSIVMPDTTHVICAWHLKHAATRNINQLKSDSDFMKEFKACINLYEEETEFLTSWDAMINKHNLHDNVWLKKVFEEKEKWARPYMRGVFSAGMKGTRLNDRFQSDVRDHLRPEVNILLLLRHLETVINDRRRKELEVEYSSRLKLPYFKIKAPILTQAFEAYTNTIFPLFQEEYEEFQSAYIVNRDESGPCREYVVSVVEKEKRYTVYGNPIEQTVSCSCKKFERNGFLCSHALKILDAMDIKYLPDRYIMKRWTKYARTLMSGDVQGQAIQADKLSESSSRYQYMCPKYVRLVARASECEESYRVLDQCWVDLSNKVEEILQKQTCVDATLTQTDVQNLKVSLPSITNGTQAENIMDKSSGTTAKESKKKGQKNKIQSRNCIEKGLRKKQKVHSEQPAEYALLGGSQSGNMFQAFEGPPNMSPLGTQTPTYKTYRGIDLSSPMGPISYDEMPSGLDPTFTTHLGFATYHTSQVSSSSPHNQAL
ncbi:protein FAR1-RELATED SEQUENCE 12-like [Oryza glaberrima]|uniref:Protein FAR1-RELATED SEQUENCE n=1 Tax=Oryza glaberrima TaxID=4538 RepID=I1PL80_ORYGL|nr:protein FAR1-RELATED SEQUENCE 12-like [Oryza glaberrima]